MYNEIIPKHSINQSLKRGLNKGGAKKYSLPVKAE